MSHVTTPVPSLHAAKSISDRKLSVAIPLATLRVTMETSSTASNRNDEKIQPQPEHQQLNHIDDDQKGSEDSTHVSEDSTKINDDDESNHVESITQNDGNDDAAAESEDISSEKIEETTSIDQRLKKISEEIEKFSNNESADNGGRRSFFSLSDLVKTLKPTDRKIIPQIDSDYSNTMHVLGETASIVGGDDSRKIKTIDLRQTNRALY